MQVLNDAINSKICTGCNKCVFECTHESICIKKQIDGFYYPEINEIKCTHCGICAQSCTEKKPIDYRYPIKSYIVLSKNKDTVQKSASGGAFFELAYYVIHELHGVACGVILDDKHKAKHICTEDLTLLPKMQGSKYVQSEMTVYDEVLDYLKSGRFVLFSGTPCQVSAIKDFCGELGEKLICVDIVCHGVGSPGLWDRQIEELAEEYSDISSIGFRKKSKSERVSYALIIECKNNKKVIDNKKSGYYSLYLQGRSLRESCYECRYSRKERVADITIGDCASWKKYYDFKPETAVSLVLFNSDRGIFLEKPLLARVYSRKIDYTYEALSNTGLRIHNDHRNRISREEFRKLIEGENKLSAYVEKERINDIIYRFVRVIINARVRGTLRIIWKRVIQIKL